jgi:Family of unknown function (DUF5941)
MSALRVYRDDGPLAGLLAPRLGRAFPAAPVALTILGALPLTVLLAVDDAQSALLPAVAAVALFVAVAATGAVRADIGRLAWGVPPLLRLVEYAALIRLTILADRSAMPLCFAVLGVLAFHHYDAVYRLRHQRVAPPAWVSAVGGGWDGRLIVAFVLAALGALDAWLLVAAIALGAVFVAESGVSWLRFARGVRPAAYEDDDEENA